MYFVSWKKNKCPSNYHKKTCTPRPVRRNDMNWMHKKHLKHMGLTSWLDGQTFSHLIKESSILLGNVLSGTKVCRLGSCSLFIAGIDMIWDYINQREKSPHPNQRVHLCSSITLLSIFSVKGFWVKAIFFMKLLFASSTQVFHFCGF